MKKDKKSGIKIITKIWILSLYSIFSFVVFSFVISYLYYKNSENFINAKLAETSAVIYSQVESFAHKNDKFYFNDDFKEYVRTIKLTTNYDILIAEDNKIIFSKKQREGSVLYKDELYIPQGKSLGVSEYSNENKDYILEYMKISQSPYYLYVQLDKSNFMMEYWVNIKKLIILLFTMSFLILMICFFFISSIKASINALYANVKRFLRSRNISQISVVHNDELYEIYDLFCSYSSKIQEASIQEDNKLIDEMEYLLDELRNEKDPSKLDLVVQKEVIKKTSNIVNEMIDILNKHLDNILNISEEYLLNNFPALQKGISTSKIQEVYLSMNKLGFKMHNITDTNIQTSLQLDENHEHISNQITNIKENIIDGLSSANAILDDVAHIYVQMDDNMNSTQEIRASADDIFEATKKYKDFSQISMEYMENTKKSQNEVEQYLDEIEYYSNKVNVLSLNSSLNPDKNSDNILSFLNNEISKVSEQFVKNINKIKQIISSNIELGKSFYSQYDGLNYNFLVKKINEISSFTHKIDNNTKHQFEKISNMQLSLESINDKNSNILQYADGVMNTSNKNKDASYGLLKFLEF